MLHKHCGLGSLRNSGLHHVTFAVAAGGGRALPSLCLFMLAETSSVAAVAWARGERGLGLVARVRKSLPIS